jgi:uncharacterized phiE125 gp8 family phage protein
MPTIVITPSTGSVLTAADVNRQCRIDVGAEDAYLEDVLIPAVAAMFEQYTRHRLLTTGVQDTFAGWPRYGRLALAWGIASAVDAVTYLDADGQEQTLAPAAWYLEPGSAPGCIHLLAGGALPCLLEHPAAVRVRYQAGFGADAIAVPTEVKSWMLAHIAHFWDEGRKSTSSADLKPLPFIDHLIAAFCRPTI